MGKNNVEIVSKNIPVRMLVQLERDRWAKVRGRRISGRGRRAEADRVLRGERRASGRGRSDAFRLVHHQVHRRGGGDG